VRPVLSIKLAVALDIDVGLHRAEWNDGVKLRYDADPPAFQRMLNIG